MCDNFLLPGAVGRYELSPLPHPTAVLPMAGGSIVFSQEPVQMCYNFDYVLLFTGWHTVSDLPRFCISKSNTPNFGRLVWRSPQICLFCLEFTLLTNALESAAFHNSIEKDKDKCWRDKSKNISHPKKLQNEIERAKSISWGWTLTCSMRPFRYCLLPQIQSWELATLLGCDNFIHGEKLCLT